MQRILSKLFIYDMEKIRQEDFKHLNMFKYAPSSFGVYSGNRELSVHLELFRIIYKRTRYAQMERMIAGKDRVMCFNLWHIF